jgi:four helix bundle protein
LIGSGTPVGANVEEAHGGESKKDFAHKMGIAEKEARESRYWFRIVKATLVDDAEVDALIQEADELVRILATIIQKTRRATAV